MPEKVCFLVAPLGDARSQVRTRSDVLYEQVVRPAAETLGYNVVRADRISVPGSITSQIVQLLLHADVVVADLSDLNPNVMYELGLRHAFRLPVIQMSSRGEHLPFDLAAVRTIFYDITNVADVNAAREALLQSLQAVESEGGTSDSPVTVADSFAFLSERRGTAAADGEVPPSLSAILRRIDTRLAAVEHRLAAPPEVDAQTPRYSQRIFIVHGHDAVLKNELARMLDKLGFDPIILHEQPDRGQTLLAKLANQMHDVGFAFVILTPDDVGAVAAGPKALQPRARQNVVFEHGLFAGRLGHERVCAIRRGEVEMPSDLHGLVYKTVPVGGGISSIALELVTELRAAGYVIDANKLTLGTTA